MQSRVPKILSVAVLCSAVSVPLMGAGSASTAAKTTKTDRLAQVEAARKVDLTRARLISFLEFDTFLKANPAIANALIADPMLITKRGYVAGNSALSSWLKAHPAMAKELESNPERVIRMAVLITAAEKFQAYLAANPALAEMLKTNPQLVTQKGFLARYPALSTWLAANPDVQADLAKNPVLFVKLSIAISSITKTS